MKAKQFDIREIARIGIFSGLAVVLGYILAPLPNIELFTATIFLAGLLFGKFNGLLVGVIAALIFAVYNPWGPSPLPLLIAQVGSRALVGFSGGLLGEFTWKKEHRWLRAVCFGVIGFLLISIYNVACAVSFVVSAGFTAEKLMAQIVAGFLLISLGTVSNVLIFSLVLPDAVDYLKRFSVLKIERA